MLLGRQSPIGLTSLSFLTAQGIQCRSATRGHPDRGMPLHGALRGSAAASARFGSIPAFVGRSISFRWKPSSTLALHPQREGLPRCPFRFGQPCAGNGLPGSRLQVRSAGRQPGSASGWPLVPHLTDREGDPVCSQASFARSAAASSVYPCRIKS